MKLSDAIRKQIRNYLEQKNMKIWDLCKLTGVPCSTITTFMNGQTELLKLDTTIKTSRNVSLHCL